jgi:AraC-like DNA-binding protein
MNNRLKKETTQHSTLLVPYKYYPCMIPETFQFMPLHWHDEMEIDYIMNGSGYFRCENEVFQANVGDIIIIPAGAPHSVTQIEDLTLEYGALVFSQNLLSEFCKSRAYIELLQPILLGRLKISTHISAKNKRHEEIKAAASSLILCAQKNSAASDLLIKSELLRIIWLLYESGEIHTSISEKAAYSEEIHDAVNTISESFLENLTIEQLAASAHMSKNGFMNKFKKEVGQSAMAYINFVRIKNACDILISTKKSTSEVAFESGFRNISNFNRQFLKYVGCSPREYRKTVEIHI